MQCTDKKIDCFVKYILSIIILSICFLSYSQPLKSECRRDMPKHTPHVFFVHGTATIEGIGDIQGSDEIRAYINDVESSNGCVGYFPVDPNKSETQYGAISIYGNDSTTQIKDGAYSGDKIGFTICHDGIEYVCKETVTWTSNGDVKEIVLTGVLLLPDFTYSQIHPFETFTVEFTSLSTGATHFLWDFGDGRTSNEENPTHTYNTEGEYDVILEVRNDYTRLSREKTITININNTKKIEDLKEIKETAGKGCFIQMGEDWGEGFFKKTNSTNY